MPEENKHTNIVIYTNEQTLLHKQDKLKDDPQKSDYGGYYWEFSRPPKKLEDVDRIYFAVKGFVVGYFCTDHVVGSYIEWLSKSWHQLKKPIPCKSFRGFRYVWWK